MMKIKEMSQRSGLSEHTLRYYEKIGLLNVSRDMSGNREYTENDLYWIEFICRLKVTGMSLKNIVLYSELRHQGESTIEKRLELLIMHEANIKNTVAELENNLIALQAKIEYYKKMK